jgi:hypothetical protein
LAKSDRLGREYGYRLEGDTIFYKMNENVLGENAFLRKTSQNTCALNFHPMILKKFMDNLIRGWCLFVLSIQQGLDLVLEGI